MIQSATKQRPRVLLVVCPILEESAARILRGIASYHHQHGPWETFWDNEGRSLHDVAWLRAGRWDGIINRHTNALQADYCKSNGIPLVDVHNATPLRGVPNICLDNVAVGALGARHLVERGFYNFGFFGYGNERWALDRRHGFAAVIRQAERECALLEPAYRGYDTPDIDDEHCEQAAAWLKSLPLPVAVMACNDYRALLLLEACRRAGLRVPEQVAVLGANDDEVRCELATPPLSSVATNHQEAGFMAAEALDRLMKGGRLEVSELRVGPACAVARQSTDVLAVGDKKIALALRLIQQRACQGLTVPEVARAVGMARTQLEQRFRDCFARSPQSEIRRVRLERIRQLLHDTNLPLQQVAELTGFAHTEYLSVFFKREVGETPGRYRRAYHEINTHR